VNVADRSAGQLCWRDNNGSAERSATENPRIGGAIRDNVADRSAGQPLWNLIQYAIRFFAAKGLQRVMDRHFVKAMMAGPRVAGDVIGQDDVLQLQKRIV
jgi:hypothetical protein